MVWLLLARPGNLVSEIMSAKLSVIEETQETRTPRHETAFGCPRDFLGNRFVYVVISPRARGLSIGLNMNPDKFCNFDCVYCEVNRDLSPDEHELDVAVMAAELEKTLALIKSGEIAARRRVSAGCAGLAATAPCRVQRRRRADVMPRILAKRWQSVVHVRARGFQPFFKMVLITNGTWLELQPIQEGLRYFTREDEVWIKLDAGTQGYMDRVNHSEVSLDKVLENAAMIGRKRPIIIQSLFPLIAGQEPSARGN